MNYYDIDDKLEPPPGVLLSCEPRTDRYGETFSPTARYNEYPRDRWRELAQRNLSSGLLANRVYWQAQEGSCACQGSVQGLTLTLRMINKDWVPPDGLSAMPPFKALSRGPNTGTVIRDNLVYLRDVGTVPIDTPANKEWMRKWGFDPSHVMPEHGYYTPLPKGCEETQKCFRIADAKDAGRFAEIIGAAADNKVGVFGLDMHAMCWINFAFENGQWWLDAVNSWGRWGDPLGPPPAIQWGRGRFSERKIDGQIHMYGAYVIEAAYIPPQFTQAA